MLPRRDVVLVRGARVPVGSRAPRKPISPKPVVASPRMAQSVTYGSKAIVRARLMARVSRR